MSQFDHDVYWRYLCQSGIREISPLFSSCAFIKHQTYNNEPPIASTRVQTQTSNKHNLVLYVDKDLVEKTHSIGFNLSKTFENHLKHLITQFSQFNQLNIGESSKNECLWWAGPDSNRRPSARQADVLTELDYRPLSKPCSNLMVLL